MRPLPSNILTSTKAKLKGKLRVVDLLHDFSWFTITFMLAVCIVCAMSLIFGYNRYKKVCLSSTKISTLESILESKSLYVQELMAEKEWLIKEMNHRVKNNLQVIVSLLNSQSSYLTNRDAIVAVKNSQHRIYTVSLVHQRLYQIGHISKINMQAYINELITYLQDEYSTAGHVTITVHSAVVYLDIALAIPLALIINEAVTNSFKYAFPHTIKGNLNLKLEEDGEGCYVLEISDNGIGLPQNFDYTANQSYGTILMTGLSQQLHADLT